MDYYSPYIEKKQAARELKARQNAVFIGLIVMLIGLLIGLAR